MLKSRMSADNVLQRGFRPVRGGDGGDGGEGGGGGGHGRGQEGVGHHCAGPYLGIFDTQGLF